MRQTSFNEFDLISHQIDSFKSTIWIPYRWVELRSIEQEKGGMSPLHMEKSG